MIHEIDDALSRLVRDDVMVDPDVEVVFDAPTRDWASRRNAPTVNIFLYDIREDIRRRQRGTIDEHEGRVVIARHQPPRYVKLSYLLTAWTQRPEDEHRLLSSLLSSLLAHDAIPRGLLGPQLLQTRAPVPLTAALPPPEDRSFADVWTAMGGELKPSLDVVVSAPMIVRRPRRADGPPYDGARLDVEVRGGGQVDRRVRRVVVSETAAGPNPGPGGNGEE